MRFGITALDWATVLSQLFSKGTLDLNLFDFSEIVRLTHNHGFSLMELTLDIGYVIPGGLSEQQVSKLLAVKEELDLTYTAHLPLWSIELCSPNSFIRNASVNCLVDSVNRVKELDPEVYVVHNAGWIGAEFNAFEVAGKNQPVIYSILGNFAEQSVRELMRRTGVPSRKFALETIQYPFETTWNIAERLDASICLDTGHILSGQAGVIDILEFVDSYFTRIKEIHLHDGAVKSLDGKQVPFFDHKPLGQGDLPVVEFFSALQERGFDGPIIFELNREDTLQSLKVIRKLLPNFPIE
ncbi:MAG: cobamide remodeling phosphodiesterase CbiR [Candidatus Thorarchaeota archaeon]